MNNFLELFSHSLPQGLSFDDLRGLVPSEQWASQPENAAILALKRSACFDEKDYLNRYPDVQQSEIDPIEHFVHHGILEKRFFVIGNEKDKKDNALREREQ